ncbi:HAD hydrolase-like protein [Candidatus Berkelbacteria bacterium]|nr:HAD hydrolase-like protein [Candidatus Berkelbacteria bacterium]
MKKLILFDIDKTLVKEMERSKNPWPEAFEQVYGINCPVTVANANSHGMTHKQIAIETLKNQGFQEKEILDKLDLFIKTFEKIYLESLENGKIILFDKIPELLQKLSKEGHVLGLITGNTKIIAYAKLKKAGIDKFFKLGGFGDDSHSRNEVLKTALDRAHQQYPHTFTEKNTFVVGDSPRDISAAEGQRLITIGVATGIYSAGDLKTAGADFVLDNLEDIEKVLSILNSESKVQERKSTG